MKKKLVARMEKKKAKHFEKKEAWQKFIEAMEERRKKEFEVFTIDLNP